MRHTQDTLTIHNLGNAIAFCEAQGLANCFQAYADNCTAEDILEGGIGFNPNSGYVYIALENGVTICSMLGRRVQYLVTDFETGEETFFDNYTLAMESLTA